MYEAKKQSLVKNSNLCKIPKSKNEHLTESEQVCYLHRALEGHVGGEPREHVKKERGRSLKCRKAVKAETEGSTTVNREGIGRGKGTIIFRDNCEDDFMEMKSASRRSSGATC